MKEIKPSAFLFFAAFSAVNLAMASGGGANTGQTLLRNSGARSSALGEAFVSMADDITAFEFNPASLATLDSKQASLQYEKGVFEDSFGKAMFGIPTKSKSSVGVSLGYYNSGKISLFDGVNPQRSVVAKQDRTASLGYGFIHNRLAIGASLRYLWSDLADTYSDSAGSVDLGVQYQLAQRFRVGISGPVVQGKIKYALREEKLPSLYRAGIGVLTAIPLETGKLPLQFLLDVPYDSTRRKVSLAMGAETFLGALALRVGLNTLSDIQQFTMGTGFQFQNIKLDYSFGVVTSGSVNSVHKITFSQRFGQSRTAQREMSSNLKIDQSDGRTVFEIKQDSSNPAFSLSDTTSQLYKLKDGETLESIALSRYGSAAQWVHIYEINRYMYSSPDKIKAGCRILLPVKKNP